MRTVALWGYNHTVIFLLSAMFLEIMVGTSSDRPCRRSIVDTYADTVIVADGRRGVRYTPFTRPQFGVERRQGESCRWSGVL